MTNNNTNIATTTTTNATIDSLNLDASTGVFSLNHDRLAPVFDRYGEWIGGREPTMEEASVAKDCADEVQMAFWEEQDALEAAQGRDHADPVI
jgi:hypothetical protein